ncbi:WecB/TagA/CpsF family glycosyltransferase [Deinococcus sp. UR1]|uniref:WecB/TagA/CpsF family glycosyltransferase n=1 Tax=Deinococcus sp. UR1 TaxID=1704277 RepID=UPI000B171124|nr:WecB/TagA/CpsF family glycosyltransferase [Deinococcus sp. UR1]
MDFITHEGEKNRAKRIHAANVHMLMEGYDDPTFQEVINTADLVVPDGVPLVWALKLLGHKEATRVYGPTLTLHVCEAAAREGIPIGLYGGTPESLLDFKAFLHHEFPGIRIACAIAPPFRVLTHEEDDAYTQEILDSGARILFVGIGCPKQEWWMYNHRDRLPLVMLGVGAAFDFHSGRVKQSPAVLQRLGLEWLFRLVMEPKRLWKRYAKHNPRFVALFARQLFNEKVLGRKEVAQ